MEESKKIEKDVMVMCISKDINTNINKLCKEHNMDKDFFVTKALENQIAMVSQNPRLVDKINKLCEEHGMSRIFFFTKALENYCKYLGKKKKGK